MRPFVARFIVFGLLILGLSGLTVLGQSGSDSKQDRRLKPVLLEKADLAGALLQVERGNLVQLSPRDFHALQAATVEKSDRLRSKVIAAKYRARYVAESNGEASLSGTAEWIVRRPRAGLAVIPLEGLQIAVRQAKWSDGLDAILYKGSPDAPTRLYVPEGDERALNLEWSTRGINEPGEIRFDLGVPSFPIATLELELPVGLTPVLPQAEAVLTGPFPAAAGEHAWRVGFGGISRLEILLRRTSEATTPLFARLISSQSLNGTEATARFEFQVESAKTGFSELHFAHDPSFIPSSVTANNLVSWAPVTGDPAKPEILVRLREPTRSAAVVIGGTSAVNWTPEEFRSPSVRLINGILRSEKLNLSVGPGLEVRDAILRDFTLVKSGQRADQSYVLELEPGLLIGSSQQHQRPSLMVRQRGQGSWTASQQSVWNVGRTDEQLEVITSVASGSSAPRAIRFWIPSGWLVERVERNNREASWSVAGPSKNILEVDLGVSLKKGELVAQLRRSRTEASQETLALPDLFPEGCSSRNGMLKIVVDPAIDAVLSEPIPNLPATPAAAMTRQLASIPLSGQLFLSKVPARHRVAIENTIHPTRKGIAITSALSISIESGSVSEISYWTPSRITGDWEWRDETGRWIAQATRSQIDEAVTSLQGLSCQPTVPMLVSRSALSLSGGYRWRLRFSRPLVRDTKLLCTHTPSAGEARLPLPIPWPVGIPFSGLVRSPSELTSVQREPRWIVSNISDPGVYAYRYGDRSSSHPGTSAEISVPEVRNARVVHSIDALGECRVSFTLHVRRWTRGNLRFTLPEGVSEPEVLVAGRPANAELLAQSSRQVEISVPRSNLWTSVELRYRLPLRPGFFSMKVQRLTPEGPFDQESVRGFWQVSPEWKPLVPSSWHVIPGTGENRQNLPAPDWRVFMDRSLLVPVNLKSGLAVVDTLALSRTDPTSLETSASGPTTIVAVERRDGVLITTRETLDRWRFEAGWLAYWPTDVDQAMSEALQMGSDSSGRFVNSEHWDSKGGNRVDPFDIPSTWYLYEDAGSAGVSPRLLHRDRIVGGTWFVSIVLVGGIFFFVRQQFRNALLVFCLLATCAAWFAVPGLRHEVAGPALFVFTVGALLNFIPSSGKSSNLVPGSSNSLHGGATLVSLVLLVTIGNGADTTPTQVSEIRDRDSKTTSYLVPAPLLDRTREANGQTPHSPVIVAASYSGSRVGTTADFRATYRLHNFEDGTARITLPILGARFRSVTLDGAEARDVDASPDGLKVAVAGKGAHVLELQFTIGIGSSGNERELKFAVPEVPMSRLSFELLGPATPIQLGGWRGAVTFPALPGGQRLEADLGTSSTISLRWTEDTGIKATTRVKQACVWQITPQSATLSSLFEYRISGGGVSTFQLAIPGNSDVSRLLIRADSTGSTTASARIRDWNISPVDGNGERKLTIQTLTPITNRVIFSLELTLTSSTRDLVHLLFPRPLGVGDAEAFAATGFDGLEERMPATLAGLTAAPVESFVREVWSSLDGSPYPGDVSAAFRADGKSPPRLSFALKNKDFPRTVSESLTWWIEPTRMLATAETRYKGSSMSTIEWTLPTDLAVVDVSGKGVASWSQGPGKVRVWMDSPVDELTLNWLATRTRPGSDAARVTIPAIGHMSTTGMSVQTRVHSANGWSLAPSERTLPDKRLPPLSAGELAWSTERPVSVSLIAHPPQEGVVLPIRTTVRPIDDRMESISLVNLDSLGRNRPHLVNIQIHNCADCTVELVAPATWTVTEFVPKSFGRHWEIAMPAEDTGARILKVVVSSREQHRGSWALPRLTVSTSGGTKQASNQVLAVDPATVSLRPEVGLTKISAAEWRVVDRDWKGTATRKIDSPRDELVRIGRHEIFVDRVGSSWIYRANYAILPNQPGLLKIAAPSGTTFLSCESNGNPLRIENGSARLHVEASVSQIIFASWSSSEPLWIGVRFALDATEFFAPEIDWRVRVQPGWTLELPSEQFLVGPHTISTGKGSKLDPESRIPGPWYEFRVSQHSNTGPNLVPHRYNYPFWPMVVACVLLLGVLLLGSMFPMKSRGLQTALVALLAAFLLGPSAGIFLLVPLVVAAGGLRSMFRRIARLLHPRDLAGATS